MWVTCRPDFRALQHFLAHCHDAGKGGLEAFLRARGDLGTVENLPFRSSQNGGSLCAADIQTQDVFGLLGAAGSDIVLWLTELLV